MKTLQTIALVLLIVGGLNWGLVALADFDLVAAIFGAGSFLARIVYGLVGLSALVAAAGLVGHAAHHGEPKHAAA